MSVPGSPPPEVAGLASRENFGLLDHTFLPRKEADVQEKRSGLFIAAFLTAIACLTTGASCCGSSWTGCSRCTPAHRRSQRYLASGACP